MIIRHDIVHENIPADIMQKIVASGHKMCKTDNPIVTCSQNGGRRSGFSNRFFCGKFGGLGNK